MDCVLGSRVTGKRVHLSPVWLMFAIFAFVRRGAVPLAAAIGVVMRLTLTWYAPAAANHDQQRF